MSAMFIHLYQPAREKPSAALQENLLRQGMAFRLHADIGELCHILATPEARVVSRLVILSGAGDSWVRSAARAVRVVDTTAIIVALLGSLSESAVSAAMESGVDICWPGGISPDRAAAAVSRLAGGRVEGAVQAGAQANFQTLDTSAWRFRSRAWEIQVPGGEVITLTSAERAILLALCRAGGQPLTHVELLSAVDPLAGARSWHLSEVRGEHRHDAAAARRLSVLMSRMRRKFEAASAETPLRSLRGVGYELCVTIDGVPAEPGRVGGDRIHATVREARV